MNLKLKIDFKDTHMASDRGLLCTPHSICFNIGFWQSILI